jgi:hypothetical protein
MGAMDSMQLIRLHLELECIGIDAAGQLVRIECLDPDTLHRVYVARHDSGDTLFFQAGLPLSLRKKLSRLPVSDFFEFPERVKVILAEDRPAGDVHIGKSYIFPETIRPSQYPDAVRLAEVDPGLVRRYDPGLDLSQKEVYGVLADGQLVSTCESSRENEYAGEAWVRTLEPYRRRGYARQVTAAWGHALLRCGKVPFYSHKLHNLASQALAQNLGLVQYLQDAGYA